MRRGTEAWFRKQVLNERTFKCPAGEGGEHTGEPARDFRTWLCIGDGLKHGGRGREMALAVSLMLSWQELARS